MMKLLLAALFAGAAAAFAPAQTSLRSSSALNMFEDRAGVIQPTGYFDPLGLATSEKLFDFYRSVELKHGRVAMLAVVGYVVPEFYRFGFDIARGIPCSSVGNGIAAFKDIPPLGWVQMIFFIGFVDQTGFLGNFEMVRYDSAYCTKCLAFNLQHSMRHFPFAGQARSEPRSFGKARYARTPARTSCHACDCRIASSRLAEHCRPRIRRLRHPHHRPSFPLLNYSTWELLMTAAKKRANIRHVFVILSLSSCIHG
jgi:Chlorophyll A-B binding protein